MTTDQADLTPPPIKVVTVHLKDGAELLARFQSTGHRDEIFVPEALDAAVGEHVLLDFYFDHSGYAFRVSGEVISRRLTRSENLSPGARIALSREDEAPIRQMILAHARGQDIEYRPRTGVRVLCRFPVRVIHRRPARGEVVDLSPGGARVVGVDPAPLGSELELKLYPPGTLFALSIVGKVVWERADPAAMGVEFRLDKPRLKKKIRDLCDRLAEEV
jgi:Tfp pilus assembly protein PilZ